MSSPGRGRRIGIDSRANRGKASGNGQVRLGHPALGGICRTDLERCDYQLLTVDHEQTPTTPHLEVAFLDQKLGEQPILTVRKRWRSSRSSKRVLGDPLKVLPNRGE